MLGAFCKTIAPIDTHMDIKYMSKTLTLWLKPKLVSLCERWSLAQNVIAFMKPLAVPSIHLRITIYDKSNMGTPKTRTGIIEAFTELCDQSPVMPKEARVKPKKKLPESPIKIFAGLKLYRKNPIKAPDSAMAKIAQSHCDVLMAMTKKVMLAINPIPPERPSILSTALKALVTPTIHINVIKRFNKNMLPNVLSNSPFDAKKRVKINIVINLATAGTLNISSKAPNNNTTNPPKTIKLQPEFRLFVNNKETKYAMNIATPPRRGVAFL
jgi:hypothetical protein